MLYSSSGFVLDILDPSLDVIIWVYADDLVQLIIRYHDNDRNMPGVLICDRTMQTVKKAERFVWKKIAKLLKAEPGL
jgi:hypothetical protein